MIKGNNYNLRFDISDTGIGIPNDKLQTIFESFSQADASVTRKYGGTGLGLTIVKQLVELQGGSINVVSKENEGSTFTLPCHTLRVKKNLCPMQG
jgi:signal transduction histidine kinase